jgi:uncharacterized Ntn-hydrolase superfamily protein
MAFTKSLLFSTYSIVARDPQTGQLGGAVQTHQMGVGRVVLWVAPGTGAVATQAFTNVRFGPLALETLRQEVPAARVVEALIATDPQAAQRQVGVVDNEGRAAAWTGEKCIAEAGHLLGEGYSVQANMMLTDRVLPAMASAFENHPGDLAARMLAALQAAQREGGDIRGMQSAALRVVEPGKPTWQSLYDLRVDENAAPLAELGRLRRLRAAQILDQQGEQALERGELEQALALWEQARREAPELEELPFWQALTLVEKTGDVSRARTILDPMLNRVENRPDWLELIRRLVPAEVISEETRDRLLSALD